MRSPCDIRRAIHESHTLPHTRTHTRKHTPIHCTKQAICSLQYAWTARAEINYYLPKEAVYEASIHVKKSQCFYAQSVEKRPVQRCLYYNRMNDTQFKNICSKVCKCYPLKIVFTGFSKRTQRTFLYSLTMVCHSVQVPICCSQSN